jgi:hypothetical protein
MARARKLSVRWADTIEGQTAYMAARSDAQKRADLMGMDVGLECNELFRQWRSFLLPCKANRTGHEIRCEVVHPTDLAKCRPGHGPGAV